MFNTAITFLADGALLGLTYFPKGDRAPEFEDEDWNELNIYFIVVRLTLDGGMSKPKKKFKDTKVGLSSAR